MKEFYSAAKTIMSSFHRAFKKESDAQGWVLVNMGYILDMSTRALKT